MSRSVFMCAWGVDRCVWACRRSANQLARKAHHGRESARKAHGVAAAHGGPKHEKWSRATQILMSSVVHNVDLHVCRQECMWFGGLWGEDEAEHAVFQHQHHHHRAAAAANQGEGGGEKPRKWREKTTKFDEHTCRLLFSPFLVPRACVHWLCVRGERH